MICPCPNCPLFWQFWCMYDGVCMLDGVEIIEHWKLGCQASSSFLHVCAVLVKGSKPWPHPSRRRRGSASAARNPLQFKVVFISRRLAAMVWTSEWLSAAKSTKMRPWWTHVNLALLLVKVGWNKDNNTICNFTAICLVWWGEQIHKCWIGQEFVSI